MKFHPYMLVAPGCALSILALGVAVYTRPRPPYDSTDPVGGRSGFTVLTDTKTGCEYLYKNGGLVPRQKPNGSQFCGEE